MKKKKFTLLVTAVLLGLLSSTDGQYFSAHEIVGETDWSIEMPMGIYENGHCMFTCDVNTNKNCPCQDVCKEVRFHSGYGNVKSECWNLVQSYCCSKERKGLLGTMYLWEPCDFIEINWQRRCLPLPDKSPTYQGTKLTEIKTVYPTAVIGSSESDAEFPAERIIGKPDFTSDIPAVCGSHPFVAMQLNSWCPVLMPSFPFHHDNHTKKGGFGPFVVVSIPPLVDIKEVSIYETSSKDIIESVHLLSTPFDYAPEPDQQVSDYINSETLFEDFEPSETHFKQSGYSASSSLNYHGNINTTVDGLPCLPWDHMLYDHPFFPFQKETSRNYDPWMTNDDIPIPMESHDGDGVGWHNFCRNPDRDPSGPWCFVWDPALGLPPIFQSSEWMKDKRDSGGGPDGHGSGPDGYGYGGPGMGGDHYPGGGGGGPDGYGYGGPGTGGHYPDGMGDYDYSESGEDTNTNGPDGGSDNTGGDYGYGYGGYGYGNAHRRKLSQYSAFTTPRPDCASSDMTLCLAEFARRGCLADPTVRGVDCAGYFWCEVELEVLCPCNDDTKTLQYHLGNTNITCQDIPKIAARIDFRMLSQYEAMYIACRGYSTICCKTCQPYGFHKFAPMENQKLIKDNFPATSVDQIIPDLSFPPHVLNWPMFKRRCDIPPPVENIACAATVKPAKSIALGDPFPKRVSAILLSLKPLENVFTGIDSIKVMGVSTSGCYSDTENGFWQEPECITCKVNSTVSWKGTKCNKQLCDKKCDHGFCDKSDKCTCYRGYAGPTCSLQCPLDSNSYHFLSEDNPIIPLSEKGISTRPDLLGQLNAWTICSGNGQCRDGTEGDGHCECHPGFAGHSCNKVCPGYGYSKRLSDYVPCSGHGTCSDGVNGNGTCTCSGVFFGEDCSQLLCSGEECFSGTCLDPVTESLCAPGGEGCFCACYGEESYSMSGVYGADEAGELGYWTGPHCDVCQDKYSGPECKTRQRMQKVFFGKLTNRRVSFGPFHIEPCTKIDAEIRLVGGNKFTAMIEAFGEPFCQVDVDVDKPIGECDIDPQVTTDPRSQNSLQLVISSEEEVDYEVILNYESRCEVSCGDHGICSEEKNEISQPGHVSQPGGAFPPTAGGTGPGGPGGFTSPRHKHSTSSRKSEYVSRSVSSLGINAKKRRQSKQNAMHKHISTHKSAALERRRDLLEKKRKEPLKVIEKIIKKQREQYKQYEFTRIGRKLLHHHPNHNPNHNPNPPEPPTDQQAPGDLSPGDVSPADEENIIPRCDYHIEPGWSCAAFLTAEGDHCRCRNDRICHEGRCYPPVVNCGEIIPGQDCSSNSEMHDSHCNCIGAPGLTCQLDVCVVRCDHEKLTSHPCVEGVDYSDFDYCSCLGSNYCNEEDGHCIEDRFCGWTASPPVQRCQGGSIYKMGMCICPEDHNCDAGYCTPIRKCGEWVNPGEHCIDGTQIDADGHCVCIGIDEVCNHQTCGVGCGLSRTPSHTSHCTPGTIDEEVIGICTCNDEHSFCHGGICEPKVLHDCEWEMVDEEIQSCLAERNLININGTCSCIDQTMHCLWGDCRTRCDTLLLQQDDIDLACTDHAEPDQGGICRCHRPDNELGLVCNPASGWCEWEKGCGEHLDDHTICAPYSRADNVTQICECHPGLLCEWGMCRTPCRRKGEFLEKLYGQRFPPELPINATYTLSLTSELIPERHRARCPENTNRTTCECDYGWACQDTGLCDIEYVTLCGVEVRPENGQECSWDYKLYQETDGDGGLICLCGVGTCEDYQCVTKCNTMPEDNMPCTSNSHLDNGHCDCDDETDCLDGGLCREEKTCGEVLSDNSTQACGSDTIPVLHYSGYIVCQCNSDHAFCDDGSCYMKCRRSRDSLPQHSNIWCHENSYHDQDDNACYCEDDYLCDLDICIPHIQHSCDVEIRPTKQLCSDEMYVGSLLADGWNIKSVCVCKFGVCKENECIHRCDTPNNQIAPCNDYGLFTAGPPFFECRCLPPRKCNSISKLCEEHGIQSCGIPVDGWQQCMPPMTKQGNVCICNGHGICNDGECKTACNQPRSGMFSCVDDTVDDGILCSCEPTYECSSSTGLCIIMKPPSPPACYEGHDTWLEDHTIHTCAEIKNLLHIGVCLADLQELFPEMPSKTYNVSRACRATCGCCNCESPPYYDSCDTILQTNHSCVVGSYPDDYGMCRCGNTTGSNETMICQSGACRVPCETEYHPTDRPCVKHSKADSSGFCICDASRQFQCINGTCGGGEAGCGQVTGARGCARYSSPNANSICTCWDNLSCMEGDCKVKCNDLRWNSSQATCTADTLFKEPLNGLCTCDEFHSCQSDGSCFLKFLFPPDHSSCPLMMLAVAQSTEITVDDTNRVEYLEGSPAFTSHDGHSLSEEIGATTWYQLFKVTDDGCLSRLAVPLRNVNCDSKARLTARLRSGSCSGSIIGEGHPLNFASATTDEYLKEWTEFSFFDSPFVTPQNGTYCLQLDVYGYCKNFDWPLIRTPPDSGIEGIGYYTTTSGDLSTGSEIGSGVFVVNESFSHPFVVIIKSSYELPMPRDGSCTARFRCGEHPSSGEYHHGFQSSYISCVNVAQLRQASYITYHEGTRNCSSYFVCIREKELPSRPFSITGPSYVCEVPDACFVSGACDIRGKDKLWGLNDNCYNESVNINCKLCSLTSEGNVRSCYHCNDGYHLEVIDEEGCVRVCVLSSEPVRNETKYSLQSITQTLSKTITRAIESPKCRKPTCYCGPPGYGWCDSAAAGGLHCGVGRRLVDGVCKCPARQWCDIRANTAGECFDGSLERVPTGWCRQQSRVDRSCLSEFAQEGCVGEIWTLAVETPQPPTPDETPEDNYDGDQNDGDQQNQNYDEPDHDDDNMGGGDMRNQGGNCRVCICASGYNCDFDVGGCISQSIECGQSAGKYGFCISPAFPDPDTRMCSCPSGFNCERTLTDGSVWKNLCVLDDECGGCGQDPCDEGAVSAMGETGKTLQRQFISLSKDRKPTAREVSVLSYGYGYGYGGGSDYGYGGGSDYGYGGGASGGTDGYGYGGSSYGYGGGYGYGSGYGYGGDTGGGNSDGGGGGNDYGYGYGNGGEGDMGGPGRGMGPGGGDMGPGGDMGGSGGGAQTSPPSQGGGEAEYLGGTFAPFTSSFRPRPRYFPSYEEVYSLPTTKFCKGPLTVMRWDFDGTGKCSCRSDLGYECCVGCAGGTNFTCVAKFVDPRSLCGEVVTVGSKQYGCRDNARAVWENDELVCRCEPGYLCNIHYKQCDLAPIEIPPAACNSQNTGGGCMYAAYPDSNAVCRCMKDRRNTEELSWFCDTESGRCRKNRIDVCHIQSKRTDNFGQCICDSDIYNGNWNGTSCESCLDQWFGATCELTCNLQSLSPIFPEYTSFPTYLHGDFRPDPDGGRGSCVCPTEYEGYPLGFKGTLCTECKPEDGKFGDNCSAVEPIVTMHWDRELESFAPIIIGPFRVMSYSLFMIEIFVSDDVDITALQTVELKTIETWREEDAIFVETSDVQSAGNTRNLKQQYGYGYGTAATGGNTFTDPLSDPMAGNGGMGFEGDRNEGKIEEEEDPTENDVYVNCREEPSWPGSGQVAECTISVPRGSGFAAIRVISSITTTVRVATKAVTGCCSGHGYCTQDTASCFCASNTELGFWSSSLLCSACATGYTGKRCTSFTAKFDERMTTPHGHKLIPPILGKSSYYSLELTPWTPYRVSIEGDGDCDLATKIIGTCEEGWFEYEGVCYSIPKNNNCHTTYEEAVNICEAEGGSLIKFFPDEDFMFKLKGLFSGYIEAFEPTPACPSADRIWIDLTREKEPQCDSFSKRETCEKWNPPCYWESDNGQCVVNKTLSCRFFTGETGDRNYHSEETCGKVGGTVEFKDKNISKSCYWNKNVKSQPSTVTLSCADGECTTTEVDHGIGACEPTWTFAGKKPELMSVGSASLLFVTSWKEYSPCIPSSQSQNGAICQNAINNQGEEEPPPYRLWEEGGSCLYDSVAYDFDLVNGKCGNPTELFGYKFPEFFCSEMSESECRRGAENQRDNGFPEYHEEYKCWHCYEEYYKMDAWDNDNPLVKNCALLAVLKSDDYSITGGDLLVGLPAYCFNITKYHQELSDSSFTLPDASLTDNKIPDTGNVMCQKPMVREFSTSQDGVIFPTKEGDMEEYFASPDCYNPVKYQKTNDACEGYVPLDNTYMAIRVTCLEPGSTYNLSMTFISQGNFFRDGPSCLNDNHRGHWMGQFCSECMPRFTGGDCKTFEPCTQHECGATGTCQANGFCKCNSNYFGVKCDKFCDENTCQHGGVCNSGYQVCNSSSGQPELCPSFSGYKICNCDRNRFAGSTCESCESGSWGANCDKNCSCSGQSCDESTGVCQCESSNLHGHWTGSDCSVCSDMYFGSDCTKYCNETATCNGHGNCDKSGACVCDAGYYSISCAVRCTAAVCSNHGTCNKVSGACECDNSYSKGFWGDDKCSTCTAGYYGTECKQDCQCAMHGTCDTRDGTCNCYNSPAQGYWTGAECTNCKDGYTGNDCTSLISVTKNKLSRVKKLSISGSDRSVKDYNSINGAAVLFNSSDQFTHLLACVGTDVAMFQKPQNDPKVNWKYIGNCALGSTLGFGDDIVGAILHKDKIFIGLTGSDFSAVVPFSAYEPLDIEEGSTKQFQCRNISSQMSITDLVAVPLAKQKLLAMALDAEHDALYVAVFAFGFGQSGFYLSRILLNSEDDWLQGASHTHSDVLRVMFTDITGLVLVSREADTNEILKDPYLLVLGMANAKPTILKVFVPTSKIGNHNKNAMSELRQVYSFQPGFCLITPCEKIYQGYVLRGWLYLAIQTYKKHTSRRGAVLGRVNLEQIKNLTAYGYLELPEVWSSSEMGIGFMLVDSDEKLTRNDVKVPNRFTRNTSSTNYQPCSDKLCGDRCVACSPTSTNCIETKDLKYCSAKGNCESGKPIACLSTRSTYIYLGLRNSTPSALYKIKVDELQNSFELLPPQLKLNYENIITQYQTSVAAVADQRTRLMYVVTKLNRVQVSVLNMYDITKLTPVYVDGNGGTIVTVVGDGFPLGLNNSERGLVASCKWQTATHTTTATIIDSQTVLCKAPKKGQFDPCKDVPLEISFDRGDRYSSNGILVRHINIAKVSSVTPLRASLQSEEQIVLEGTGFLDSPYLACAINNVTTNATWVLSISMLCTHPKTDVPAVTTVEVTLDGQIFSKSQKQYLIVGPPTQISFSLGGSETRGKSDAYTFHSQQLNKLDTIQILFLDSAGNEIRGRDEQVRQFNVTIRLDGPSPSRKLPCPTGPCGQLNGIVSQMVTNGEVQFDTLELEYPGTGIYKLLIDVIDDRKFECYFPDGKTTPPKGCLGLVKQQDGSVITIPALEIKFEITALATRLIWLTPPPIFSTNKGELAIQPQLEFVDVSDNVATTHGGKVSVQITPNDGKVRLSGTQGDRTVVEYKDGQVKFFKLQINNGREGKYYQLHFKPDTPTITGITSRPLYIAVCSNSNDPISSIHPSDGQLSGRLVTIKGWDFAESNKNFLKCRFGDDPVIPATFVDTCTLLCPLQAKTAPRTASLTITMDASGIWHDLGFNYSYIDVISTIGWSIAENILVYPSSSLVNFRDIIITLRDEHGNWLRSWDTEPRVVYLKSRLAIGGVQSTISGITQNGKVVFPGLQVQLPLEGKYTLLFTTDPNAAVPSDLWQYDKTIVNNPSSNIMTITEAVEETQSAENLNDRFDLFPNYEITGAMLHAGPALFTYPTLALPEDASVSMNGVFIQLSSDGEDPTTGVREFDVLECASICDQIASRCGGFRIDIQKHECYFYSFIGGTTPLNGMLSAIRINFVTQTDLPSQTLAFDSCAPRNCTNPDEEGSYECIYSYSSMIGRSSGVGNNNFGSLFGSEEESKSLTQTRNSGSGSSVPAGSGNPVGVSFTLSNAILIMNNTLSGLETSQPDVELTSSISAEFNETLTSEQLILQRALVDFSLTPPSDACLSVLHEVCPPMGTPRHYPDYLFSTDFIIIISEGKPHQMTFETFLLGGVISATYSRATTNRRMLDIQPVVVIQDISGNEVQNFAGSPSVVATVKPYCIKTPQQSVDDFRYPERASDPSLGGCIRLLTEEELSGGVSQYGRLYGPSCHGTVSSGQTHQQFEESCERLRGGNAWVTSARATFTEIHFRGCASDTPGVTCFTDIRYRIHFDLLGAGVKVPELVSDSIYTANCPKSNNPLSHTVPVWAKLIGGVSVTLKGWDFQPQRKLKVNLAGLSIQPEFVDTCTAVIQIPSATASEREAIYERDINILESEAGRTAATLSFASPSAATLKIVDEDNPDFESEPMTFQIKSSLPEGLGLIANPIVNDSIVSDAIDCSEVIDDVSTLPKLCFRTSQIVDVGELQIILKDGAGGDLYATASTYLEGENFGFFEDVADPNNPKGPKVWGREFSGSLDQARDVFVIIEVILPSGKREIINSMTSTINMTESQGEGSTFNGLLSIADAKLFFPKTGEYVFNFVTFDKNIRGNPHANGGVRITIEKGSAVYFVVGNMADLVLESDGVSPMSPSPKLEFLDIANNSLIIRDLGESGSGLEILASIVAYKVNKHPSPDWGGWQPHEKIPLLNETYSLVENIIATSRWTSKVDVDNNVHPLGVSESIFPSFSFSPEELGGGSFSSPQIRQLQTTNGELRTVRVWHDGPSLSRYSAPMSIGAEFKDFKVQGLWHGVEYAIRYTPSIPGYSYLGQQSHPIWAVACQEGQFSLNFSSICVVCPEGGICDRTQFIRAKPDWWRFSQSDITFYNCKPNACNGGYFAGDDSCQKGSEGPLCAVCSSGYGKSDSVCVECPSRSFNIFMMVLFCLMLFIVIFVMVKTNLTQGSKGKSLLSIVIKLLMNYLQTASLMKSFLVKVKGIVSDLLAGEEKASGPSTQFISFSCASGLDQYGVFTMWMLLPIIVIVIPGIITAFLHAVRAIRKGSLMGSLVETRNRRYSIGMDAEQEEERIAVLHAVQTGKPVPNFASRSVSRETGTESTASDELIGDFEAMSEMQGDGLNFTEGFAAIAAEERESRAREASRKLLTRKANKLRKANALAKEEVEMVIRALDSNDPTSRLEALEIVKKAQKDLVDPEILKLESQLEIQIQREKELAEQDMKGIPENFWEEKISKTHGRKYWKNKRTGESSWSKPADVIEYENYLKRQEALQSEETPSSDEAAELLDPSILKARMRWKRIREIVMECIRNKRDARRKQEEAALAWQMLAKPIALTEGNSKTLSRCMVCEADFSAFMCKDCGEVERIKFLEKKAARRKGSIQFDNIVFESEPKKLFIEQPNGHAYFFICQYCDRVLHAPRGSKGNHLRIRVRSEEEVDDEKFANDPEMHKMSKSEKKAKPEVIYSVTVLIVVFLAYPRLMTEIATLMKCYEIPDTGKSFLEADMRIECSSPSYDNWKKLAIIFFFLYGFGIPIMGIITLSAWAGKDGTGLLRKKVVESFGFLYSGFRMSRYYWEMIIMFRKMLVVFVLVFYEGRQQYQTMFGTWLMTFFLMINIFTKPFMYYILWRIENLSLACIALSLNMSMLYQTKYKLTVAMENAITTLIFLLNAATLSAFLYCIYTAAKQEIIEMFDDPNDPDGSLTWAEVKMVARIKLYRNYASYLKFFGIRMKNPEDAMDEDAERIKEALRTHNTDAFVDEEIEADRTVLGGKCRNSILTMPAAMAKSLGYMDKYPTLFNQDGTRRASIASTSRMRREDSLRSLKSVVNSTPAERNAIEEELQAAESNQVKGEELPAKDEKDCLQDNKTPLANPLNPTEIDEGPVVPQPESGDDERKNE